MNAEIRRQFLKDYSRIRRAEGRGSCDSEYFRALPYKDLTGRNSGQWKIRAATYRYFENKILKKVEAETGRPLRILDLGAGNGWMSYRLSLRKHHPVALDIFPDYTDGLGAICHYPIPFPAVEAGFDQLPFPDGVFDLVIYNSSLHYATDYHRALSEASRVLSKNGRVIIMDTPVYRLAEHGEKMRTERHEQFERQYGFRSDAIPSIEFLDEAMLNQLARDLTIEWHRSHPWYGIQWALRPWKALLRSRRPPSRFFILTGRFTGA